MQNSFPSWCITTILVISVTTLGCSRLFKKYDSNGNELIAGVDRPFNKYERAIEISEMAACRLANWTRKAAKAVGWLGFVLLESALFGWLEESEFKLLFDEGYGYRLKKT
ncbi:MAG: hypothetical protein AAGA30_21185 [Planctomycetota bacterium]